MSKVIRYFVVKEKNTWLACSLEFGLAVQCDDGWLVEHRLIRQIIDFAKDGELLDRRAIPKVYFLYYWYYITDIFRSEKRTNIFIWP
jgi:hypothetical protein